MRVPSPRKEMQILRAAEMLFTSRRFHEVTMEEIAGTAAVGKGTLYRYFADKDALFREVALSGYRQLVERINRIAANGSSFEKQLQQIMKAVMELYRRKRRLFRLIQAEDSRVPSMQAKDRNRWRMEREHLVHALSGWIVRGVKAGRIRSDVPPETIATSLLAILRAAAGPPGRRSLPAPAFNDMTTLFLEGAASRETH